MGGALLLVAAGWCYRQKILKHKAVKPLAINECALIMSQKPKKDFDLYEALEKFDCGYVRITSNDQSRGLYYINRKTKLIHKFDMKDEDLTKLDAENIFSLHPKALDKFMFATIFSTSSELCCGLLLSSSTINELALFKALDNYDAGFLRVQNSDDTGGLYFVSAVPRLIIKFQIADDLLTGLDNQQFFTLKHALLDHNQLTTLIDATNDEEASLPVRTIQQTAMIFHKDYLECFLNEIFAEKSKRLSAVATSSSISAPSKDEWHNPNLCLSSAYKFSPDFDKDAGSIHVFHRMSSSTTKKPSKSIKVTVSMPSKFQHVFRVPLHPSVDFSASGPYSQKTQSYLQQTLPRKSTVFDSLTQKALAPLPSKYTLSASQYNYIATQWVEDHMNKMVIKYCQNLKTVSSELTTVAQDASLKHDISVRSFSPVENESNKVGAESLKNDVDDGKMVHTLASDLTSAPVNDSSSDEDGTQEDFFKENQDLVDLKALDAFNQTIRFFDRRATVYSRRLSTAPSPNHQSDIRQVLRNTRPTLDISLKSPVNSSAHEAIDRPLQKQVTFISEPLETILDIPARAGTAPAQKSRKESSVREEHKELNSPSNHGKSIERRNSEHVSRIQPYLNKQSSNRFFEKRRSSQLAVHPTIDVAHHLENTAT